MAHEFQHPVIGQEAVCPDGLGRVVAFKDRFPEQWIQVDTYVGNRGCKWSPENVRLVAINYDSPWGGCAMKEKPKEPDIVSVAYWDSEAYTTAGGNPVKPFQVELGDKRETSGQVFIDVAAQDGKPELLAAVTVEINRVPSTEEDVPCVHLHFDESNLAASFFKQGDRFVIRPESGVRITSGLLENGEHAWFLEDEQSPIASAG